MGAISEVGFNTSDLDSPNGAKSEEVKQFNYITEMQKLVGQIFSQLSRISANDHETIERMKEKYMNATLKSAHLQIDSGRVGRNIGVITFTVFCLRLGFPNGEDKEIVGVISQQIPNLGGMYTSGLQSQMNEKNAEATLEMEKYRTKTQAKVSEGNAKQDYVALLQSVGENQKSASRASS